MQSFFECIKKFLDGKISVLEEVECHRELDFFIECLERNIFYGDACRNRNCIVFGIVVERDEDRWSEAFFAPLDESRCDVQVLVAKVFGLCFEDLAELVEVGGLLFLIVFCRDGEEL